MTTSLAISPLGRPVFGFDSSQKLGVLLAGGVFCVCLMEGNAHLMPNWSPVGKPEALDCARALETAGGP